jgi:hypothetical protein
MILHIGTIGLLSLMTVVDFVTGERFSVGLADPAVQDLFTEIVPNPLDPDFIFDTSSGFIEIAVSNGIAHTGLKNQLGVPLTTPIWGYGCDSLGYTWPGRTIEVESGEQLRVLWLNKIPIVSVMSHNSTTRQAGCVRLSPGRCHFLTQFMHAFCCRSTGLS